MNERHRNITEQDVRQALNTASAIGDDRLQKESRGYAVPDSFTHGSSEQRMRWFMTGMKGGSVRGCNTFNQQRV
jgi:predicted metalloprotease